MKRKIISILSVVAMMISSVSFVPAQAQLVENDEVVTYIVKVAGDPMLASEEAEQLGVSEYLETEQAKQKQVKLLRRQKKIQEKIQDEVDSSAHVTHTYTSVYNGFAIRTHKSMKKELLELNGVVDVSLSEERMQPLGSATEISNVSGEFDSCCNQMNVENMRSENYKGQGTVVGVIDTELDYEHENFQNPPSNPRYSKANIQEIIEEKGLDAEGEELLEQAYKSEKVPFAYNYENKDGNTKTEEDSLVHGTHVAGISVGSAKNKEGKCTGMAPEAQLIFAAVPHLGDAGLIAAFDDMVKFDVDVINCSFGSKNSEYVSGAYYEAVQNVLNAGITISGAAGNDSRGFQGNEVPTEMVEYDTSGSPATYSDVTAVASLDNNKVILDKAKIRVSFDTMEVFLCPSGAPKSFLESFRNKRYDYVDCGYGLEEECKNVAGKIAIIRRGEADKKDSTFTFDAKLANAKKAGAVGAIIVYILKEGERSPVGVRVTEDIPVALIREEDLTTLLQQPIKKLQTTGNAEKKAEVYTDGSKISNFSSWCCNATLELKPEITAVGGKIYSSYPNGKYTTMQGTSMAAPHYAGAIALMSQYLSKKYPENSMEKKQTMENLFMSSAQIMYQDEAKKVPYSPRLQGAGLVDLDAVTKASSYFIGDNGKSKLSLYDQLSEQFELTFTVKNITNNEVTYSDIDLITMVESAKETEEKGYVINGARLISNEETELPKSITIAANGTKRVKIKVKLDAEELAKQETFFPNGFFMDGYISLGNASDESVDIHMPFSGFYGDWNKELILDESYYHPDSKYQINGLYRMDGDFEYKGKLQKDGIKVLDYPNLGEFYDANQKCYLKGEKYAGISPNGDKINDNLLCGIVCLRTANYIIGRVEDREGKVVRIVNGFSPYVKFANDVVMLNDQEMNSWEDGEYTFYIRASHWYKENSQEEISMKFYLDRVQPQFESANVTTEGDKKYIQVSVKDDWALNCMEISDEKGHSEFVPLSGDTMETKKMDITDYELSTLKLKVTDCAMNGMEQTYEQVMATPEPTAIPTIAPTQQLEAIETPIPVLKTQKITTKKIKKYFAKKLKKKRISFKLGAKTNGDGKLTYTLRKKEKKYIKITKKGKITLKKKCKKSVYHIKITAQATTRYKVATKTVKIVVK